MHGEDLYYDHEELMTSEEKEDAEYIPGRNYEPSWFRNWVMEGSKYQADAEGRKKFRIQYIISIATNQISHLLFPIATNHKHWV